MTKTGSISRHRIEYNAIGVLTGLRHIPSKLLTQVTPLDQLNMQLRKEATFHSLYDSTLLVPRAFPLENMKGK